MLKTFTVITQDRKQAEEREELEKITGRVVEGIPTVILKRIQLPVESIVETVETEYDSYEDGETYIKEGTLIVLETGKTLLVSEDFDTIERIRLEDEREEELRRLEYLAALSKK